jgi:DNA-3-methyladenine glycosylase II
VAEICYARIGQLFDLACDPQQVARTLGDLAQARPGLRLPGALDAFEQAVRAVLGQLVSVAMAARLTPKWRLAGANRWRRRPAMSYSRRQRRCPGRSAGAEGAGDAAAARGGADPPRPGGAQRRAAPDGAGGYRRRAASAADLPGIGRWTANYFALRGWQAKDIFLPDDYLIKQRFPGMTPAAIARYARRWQPMRSYALLHIWYTDDWRRRRNSRPGRIPLVSGR